MSGATSAERLDKVCRIFARASRGDVLTTGAAPLVSDQLAAHVVWFDDDAKLPGRRYVLKCGSSSTGA